MNLLQIMMRNMRQFMSGMKNYLVKHGEREFEKEVEKERLKVGFQSITYTYIYVNDILQFSYSSEIQKKVLNDAFLFSVKML